MFGEHSSFIVPAYLITAVSLIGVTAFVWFSYRARKRELRELEEGGVTRRSGEKS